MDAAAVDTGSSDQAPATDRDGVPRPFGAGVDIGAYEWTDAPPPTDAGGAVDAGGAADAGGTADAGTEPGGDGGCGCTTPGQRGGSGAWLLLFLAALVWRRRHVADRR